MNTKWNKNIKFLGTAEFASRWRKELTPGTVSTGKTISRFISSDVKAGRGKNLQDEAISFIKRYSSDEKKELQNKSAKKYLLILKNQKM